jgi:hypothetical protein
MSTRDKLELNKLKQDLIRTELDAVNRQRTVLLSKMMELTSEEVNLKEENINQFNLQINENTQQNRAIGSVEQDDSEGL